MKNEELEVITNSIKETLGEESTALIADSLGLLMSENTRVYNSLVAKDKEIDQLNEVIRNLSEKITSLETETKNLQQEKSDLLPYKEQFSGLQKEIKELNDICLNIIFFVL